MNLEPTETNQKGEENMYKKNNERRSIPLRVRFEVFKRDNFTCRTCGKNRSDDDVKLEIDHITPVSKGGTNDITNLVTLCWECNRGKADKLLDDNTYIEIQHNELINHAVNINNVKQMHELKQYCDKNRDIECKIFEDEYFRLYGIMLDENGKKNAIRLIKNYGIEQIFDSLDTLYTRDISNEINFNILVRQIKYDCLIKEKPHLKDVFYIRKILINKFDIKSNLEKNALLKYIEEKFLDNYDKDIIMCCALDCSSIRHFCLLVEGNKKEGQAS